MHDNEKRAFSDLMDATLPVYRMEASRQTKLLWWQVLKAYSLESVSAAFGEHVSKNAKGITPADISNLILAANHDGRPGADEAWAMLPYRDEESTVVMTEEMSEAFGIASQVDDRNGARMAFREAYNRIVDRNKRAGIAPRWFASLGSDKNGREIALNEAVRLGRLRSEHVAGLLPSPASHGVNTALLSLVSVNGIRTDSGATDSERETARKRLDELKAMLTRKSA